MFIHAGAGLHGHEYSSQKPTAAQQQNTHSLPFLRSALRVRADPTDVASDTRRNSLQSLPSPPTSPPPNHRRHTTEYTPRRDVSVRFQEPTMEDSRRASIISEDNESLSESVLSEWADISGRKQKRKRAPRQSSRFILAHPAPQLRTKQRRLVQFRPRLLLQLQEMSNQRPTPAFDILPSSLIAGSVIIPHLAKRFPGVFLMKPELGQDDLLVVRSEDYNSNNTDTKGHHGRLHDRDLVAVISPLPEQYGDSAEIVMADGSVWLSKETPSGSYDFTKMSEDGKTETARWVRRNLPPSRTNSDTSADFSPPSSPAAPEGKWTFSMIDPLSRRHPILGILRSNELQVYHDYSTMSTSSNKYPPTRPFSPTTQAQERSTEIVSEKQRQLMLITASWISLRQKGWPFSPTCRPKRHTAQSKSGSSSHTDSGKTASISRSSSTGTQLPKRFSLPNPTPFDQRRDSLPEEPTTTQSGPQRALSTGAAFMRRRRIASLHADDIKSMREKEEEAPIVDKPRLENAGSDDKTHVGCRIKVRQFTQRLFNRKSCRA